MHKVYCDRCGKEIDIKNNRRSNREAKEPYYLITAFRPVTREHVRMDGKKTTHTFMRSYYPQYCEKCTKALTEVLDMWEPLKYLEDNDLLDADSDTYDGPECDYMEE